MYGDVAPHDVLGLSHSFKGREGMRLIVDRDVPVEMRDGTILRADVYRPDSNDRFPVLLQRTPYDKNVPRISALLLNPMRAASAGYAHVTPSPHAVAGSVAGPAPCPRAPLIRPS